MRNYRLTVCYDGTRYKGWQRLGSGENTVQAKLEGTLSKLLGEPIELDGSGRTDAGVHARRQVCSFKAETDMPRDVMLTQLRHYLPEDIGALSLEYAPPRFHARLNCIGKTYVYTVWNSDEPNVFGRRFMYAFPQRLDDGAMLEAAKLLCGTHDYSGFCSNKRMKKSAVRTVESIELSRQGSELRFILSGDGFLYNMVRIIVGTLLEVGSGQRSIEAAVLPLNTLIRADAGFTAPAHGLCLFDVRYGE